MTEIERMIRMNVTDAAYKELDDDLAKTIEQYVIKAKKEQLEELRDRHNKPMNSTTEIILDRMYTRLLEAKRRTF